MAPLDEVIENLKPHAEAKGETVEQFFNRQLHERVSERRLPKQRTVKGWACVRLAEDAVGVVQELWTLEKLLATFPKPWHTEEHEKWNRDAPPPALAVFSGWGQQCLIDGHHRLNYWRRVKDFGPHRILVVKPRKEIANPFPKTV